MIKWYKEIVKRSWKMVFEWTEIGWNWAENTEKLQEEKLRLENLITNLREVNKDTTKQEEQLAKIEAKLDKNSSILKNIDKAPNRVAGKIDNDRANSVIQIASHNELNLKQTESLNNINIQWNVAYKEKWDYAWVIDNNWNIIKDKEKKETVVAKQWFNSMANNFTWKVNTSKWPATILWVRW